MGKVLTGFVFAAGAVMVLAQTPPPTLSTADKVAIQAFEEKKSEATKTYQAAQSGEQQVVKEWDEAHKGFHLNPVTFAVEPDAKAEAPKK